MLGFQKLTDYWFSNFTDRSSLMLECGEKRSSRCPSGEEYFVTVQIMTLYRRKKIKISKDLRRDSLTAHPIIYYPGLDDFFSCSNTCLRNILCKSFLMIY